MLFGIAIAWASDLPAQSLMVGEDGAVHLDEMSGAAGEPIIIDQQPELVGPSAGTIGPQSEFIGNTAGYPGTNYATPMFPAAVAVVPGRPVRHGIFGEFLFLHPTGADVAHAQQQNGLGGAGTVPYGTIGVTDLHYEPGVRVGGDWAMSDVTSIAGTYTWFESNAASRVTAPTVPGGGGAVGSLVHHPGAAITASPGPVDGRLVLDFQLADADYRALLLDQDRFWLNGSVGLRWGHLEQHFGQTGPFIINTVATGVTQSDIEFDGGGPKFGVDGGRAIGKRGLSVYARAGVSPLAGQFRSRYRMINDTTDELLVQADWNDDRIVTLLDYEVGFAWTGPQRRWRFATGYTATYWFNAVTTSEYVGAVQNNAYNDVSDTIVFEGLTARIERMW